MNLYIGFTLVILAWVQALGNAAQEEQVVLGCLGKMPAIISKAIKDNNLVKDLPRPKRETSSGKTTTTPKPSPKANLDPALQGNVENMLAQLGVVDLSSKDEGVSYTKLRQLFDKNYPTGAKQTQAWREWKKCAQNASDYRRGAKEEISLFIDCLVAVYKKICEN